LENLKGRGNFGDLRLDGIIFKLILEIAKIFSGVSRVDIKLKTKASHRPGLRVHVVDDHMLFICILVCQIDDSS
jgi:hypothetical protein